MSGTLKLNLSVFKNNSLTVYIYIANTESSSFLSGQDVIHSYVKSWESFDGKLKF